MNNKVEALKLAREMFESGEQAYVCNALKIVEFQNIKLADATRELRDIIENRIYPYSTVTEWLSSQGVDVFAGDAYDVTENFRQYRIRWIDSMIREFS